MLVRVAISHSGTLARVLAEDSGEMVVVSLTVAFSLTVYRRYGRNPGQPSPMS